LTGAVALALKPASEKQVLWTRRANRPLFPASRIVERYDQFDRRQLRSTVRFGSRSSHGPLERIQAIAATWWSGTIKVNIENVVRADLLETASRRRNGPFPRWFPKGMFACRRHRVTPLMGVDR
jgi:hypothetical protein